MASAMGAPPVQQSEQLRSCVPPVWVLRLVNPVVSALLRSRWHGLASKQVVLLTYTGRKSGRAYTIPVGYVRDGDAVTIYSGVHRWWRNLRGGADVSLLLEGHRRGGRAELIEDPATLVREAERLVERYGPSGASSRIGVDLGPAPTPELLARAMAGHAVIRVSLEP